MKLPNLALFVAATVSLSSAQAYHHHSHQHIHYHHVEKRDITPVLGVKHEPVTVYELNGQTISESEFQEGLSNGTFYLGDSHIREISNSLDKAHAPVGFLDGEKPASPPVPSLLDSMDLSIGEKESSSSISSSGSSSTLSFDGPVSGVDIPFPNGEVGCSDFPSQYGAVAIPWLGLGGWAGVQLPGSIGGNGMSNIETITSGLLGNKAPCTESAYCSYACAYGYQKSQWPQMQGETGQSIGGLQCKNGKLHLTNAGLSNKLCIPGTSAVSVTVRNLLDEVVSVCRTDYPGTENMVIPLSATQGSSYPLTVPNSNEYYHWQTNGQSTKTSAQYYVNDAGIPVNEACVWGTGSQILGNFSPLVIGASYDNNAAYLSIFQNAPTTLAKLDYSVEIVGENGGYSNVQGRCKYSHGQYCSGDDYSNCNEQGCTVAVPYGSATYVFSA